jgi:hypothetical protein
MLLAGSDLHMSQAMSGFMGEGDGMQASKCQRKSG